MGIQKRDIQSCLLTETKSERQKNFATLKERTDGEANALDSSRFADRVPV